MGDEEGDVVCVGVGEEGLKKVGYAPVEGVVIEAELLGWWGVDGCWSWWWVHGACGFVGLWVVFDRGEGVAIAGR